VVRTTKEETTLVSEIQWWNSNNKAGKDVVWAKFCAEHGAKKVYAIEMQLEAYGAWVAMEQKCTLSLKHLSGLSFSNPNG
jgi:hypothetical protein